MNLVLRLKDLINYVSVKSSVIAIRFKVLLVKTFMNSIWHETQQFARIHVTSGFNFQIKSCLTSFVIKKFQESNTEKNTAGLV